MSGNIRYPVTQCKGDRHTYHKKEKGKYQVCRCTSIPFGMFQWCVNMVPVSRVVYKDHTGYGKTTKEVK
jgi:hypothetical protein